ncbi:Roadblock/LC7 domain protein [uncultured archaeon]|nr:Roadblock/LC7 domain protein [uncultured archaeon]
MLILFLVVAIAAVVLSGCVQKNVYPSEKETIETERLVDVNGDGVPDQAIYVFASKDVGPVTIKRELLVQRDVGNTVIVRLNILSKATDKITDVTVREVIPSSLTTTLERVNFTPKYSELLRREPPITVSWKFTFSGREEVGKTVEYSTVAFQEIDKTWVERYAQSPYIEVQVIDPNAVPFFVTVTQFGSNFYGLLKTNMNFYIASGIYGALLFVIVLLYLELLSLVAAYVVSLVKKTPLTTEVYNFLGHGRKDNNVWIAAGVGLMVVGSAIALLTTEAPGSADLETLLRLGSNIPKTIGAFVIAIGVISIYYAAIDVVKGMLLGERYFMTPLDIARARLRDISGMIDSLENSIMTSSESGIDTETEEVVADVERRRLERLIKDVNDENAEQYMPQIAKAISDIQTAVDSLAGKKEVLTDWPVWRNSIDEMLLENDRVGPEMLVKIPQRWRRWALARYMAEHLGEAITIDNGALVKIKTVIVEKKEVIQLLNGLMQAGKMEGVAAMRKDGLLIAAMLPKEVDQNMIAAVSAKVIANAEMASMELERGKTRFVMLKSTSGDTIIYGGRTIVLVALVKSGETIGFVVSEMAKITEKLDSLI